MTAEQSGIRYQAVRAPRSHGEVLVQPSPLNAQRLIAENRSRLASAGDRPFGYGGVELDVLRREARLDILRIAREHTSAYRDVPEHPTDDGPLIMTGHQPALYHPGVWFKNFLADRIASQVQGIAINVIIDNDVAPAPSISALSGTPGEPRPTRIAYDQPGPRVAWEMTYPQSMETLRSFAKRAEATIEPFVANSLVSQFWPRVVQEVEAGKPLGLAFSVARNCLEESLGLQVLDVPLSRLCQTQWFCRILGFILVNATSYRGIYNQCVQDYRDVHKIRSTSHPVPDLGVDEAWVEVPFWVWTKKNASRRGLWVSSSAGQLMLTDQAGWQIELSNDEDLPARLEELASQGVYIRPRALMTTTILRLVASDLFIHGIGGAKYDQVTDEINRHLIGLDPPEYVTATATAQLPIDSIGVSKSDLQEIESRLRDAEFNPDRAIAGDIENNAQWQSLLKQKSSLLANVPNFPEKRLWHRQLAEVNSKLRNQIAEPVARLRIERAKTVHMLHQKQLSASREYSFLLFPQEGLRNLLLDLAEKEI
ncbi:hypothetical protein [Bremerella alba]|uniref:Uncharacterized protein n=1 Tax=Bremerella alba TaxID=980252 RepID=A0A7V8V424_9BACT|nr:hypothetical protein [Bremerella alba]MBA2114543.1 hypothetical protein [Bremerella alba]